MRIQLSVFHSDDFTRKAIVYLDQEKRCFEIDFAKDGLIVSTESYIDHSLQYHEDAAENYVLGVKSL